MDDLETYQKKRLPKNVLLFPPLPSRLRYLIHRKVEDIPELATFSVGESWCRRVVVCPSELRAESDEDGDLESDSCVSEEPRGNRAVRKFEMKAKPLTQSQSRAPKRPDQPFYMPRAARERLPQQNSQGTPANKEACAADSMTGLLDSESRICPQEKTQKSALRLEEIETVVLDEFRSLFAEAKLEDVKGEDFSQVQTEETSTDTNNVTEQIKMHLKETDVSVELVHSDYSVYENVVFNSDDFCHVIEIYDFPPFFNTDDLLNAFTDYSNGGMKIKWVDHTHALGVFSCEAAAHHALSICHPLLKARALSKGSKQAKAKAIRRAEFIQPVKERPRTDCAVAKRMVTRALGVRGRVHRY